MNSAIPAGLRDVSKEPECWELRLYVAGQSPKSLKASANLARLCEEHLPPGHKVEIVDAHSQGHRRPV